MLLQFFILVFPLFCSLNVCNHIQYIYLILTSVEAIEQCIVMIHLF